MLIALRFNLSVDYNIELPQNKAKTSTAASSKAEASSSLKGLDSSKHWTPLGSTIYTCKGSFRTYKGGWYHGVHDHLREWHWESPGWCRRGSLIHHAFPYLLQIPAQFLVGPAKLFLSCLRHSQVNLDAFLIHYGCRHRLLKGVHRLHDLLHGDVFPSVRCDRSLPRVPHIAGSLLYTCE